MVYIKELIKEIKPEVIVGSIGLILIGYVALFILLFVLTFPLWIVSMFLM